MTYQCPRKLLTTLVIAAAMLPSYAQTTGQSSRVVVFIPFDFVVADKTLRSGRYEITLAAERVLSVQSTDGGEHAYARTIGGRGGNSDDLGQVMFNCYSHRCFLSKGWAAGHDLGWELVKSKSETQWTERSAPTEIAVLNR